MDLFNVISLFGGLSMFLYGMHLMSDNIKESSSGTLKVIMEKVTNNTIKAFFLGVFVTALIQSSKATIVITAGLVGAGIITFRQSLGIIVGANVGTTITGQIIRLLDVEGSGGILELLQPSNFAPVALIIGIVLVMFVKFNNSKVIGNILMGFGILFTGLLNMTAAVDLLANSGSFESLITFLNQHSLIGYLFGGILAFILQSSSASVGVLQAFSSSEILTFSGVYIIILGIYLGECITTYMVAAESGGNDSRRVGMVHVVYTVIKSVLSLAGTLILRAAGILVPLWNVPATSGTIANINTVFNLASAVVIFPMITVLEKIVNRIIKDGEEPVSKYNDKLEALSPAFFATPALALRSMYDVLLTMYYLASDNIRKAFQLQENYDQKVYDAIKEEEGNINLMADRTGSYLVELSGHLTSEYHVSILNQYYKIQTEFEHLGDYALSLADEFRNMKENDTVFSEGAHRELRVMSELMREMLIHTELAFKRRDLEAAKSIEPLKEVGREILELMKDNHLKRITNNECDAASGLAFINVISIIDQLLATCSNIGMAIVVRVDPSLETRTHAYLLSLHSGNDEKYNKEYSEARENYLSLLEERKA